MTTKIVIGFVIKARINQIKPLSPNRNNKVKEGPSNNSWSLLVIFYFSNSIFPAHSLCMHISSWQELGGEDRCFFIYFKIFEINPCLTCPRSAVNALAFPHDTHQVQRNARLCREKNLGTHSTPPQMIQRISRQKVFSLWKLHRPGGEM